MNLPKPLVEEHVIITRRYFLSIGAMGITLPGLVALSTSQNTIHPLLSEATANLEYLTRDQDFKNYGRGNPPPHELPIEKRREVGLTRETWQLEVVASPDSDAQVKHPLTRELGTALDWRGLMRLAERHAVRFLHVMSCTNGRSPCGMGLWEGVPLRELIWMAQPEKNIRRVYYYGYHNDDPQQRFQSSLPIGRVLEDPPGEHPVILCYKLNGELLSDIRGGPVRAFVPDAYGNKSVKWLQRIVLTNDHQANDTYALWNNDTATHLKTWAYFLHAPEKAKVGQSIPITGLAQVGMSGLSRIQYWLWPEGDPLPEDDPYFAKANWKDAVILPPPGDWGGGLPSGKLPPVPSQIDSDSGEPLSWPLRNTIVHWAALMTDVSPGRYELRCRTIDGNEIAQPMPRPFPKSGYNSIQRRTLVVE